MTDRLSSPPPKILCIDDDNTILLIYQKYLRNTGYQLFTAKDAQEGFSIAKSELPDLIISDVVMPGETGLELCRKIRADKRLSSTIFLLTSGKKTTAADALTGVTIGADDYILKPFEQEELLAKIKAFLRIKKLQDDFSNTNQKLNTAIDTLKDYKKKLEEKNLALIEEKQILENSLKQISLLVSEREKTNQRLEQLIKTHEKDIGNLIKLLSELIESKRQYHRGHSKKVAEIAVFIARRLNLSEEETRNIQIAARLHELGKLSIPEELAMKNPEHYTQKEKDFLTQHPVKGAALLEKFSGFESVADIIRHFHEQYDGSGAPDGLIGDDIPMGSRIIAAANLFDNLVYRKQDVNIAHAFTIIEDAMGSRYDPNVGLQLHKYTHEHPPDQSTGTRELSIFELEPGMVLASGIYTVGGAKLLPINTVLTEAAINKIANYNKTEPIGETVFIKH